MLTRRLVVPARHILKAHEAVRPHDHARIPFSCSTSGSYPLRPYNRVQPLVDGEPTFRRIGEAIEAAGHSIWATVAFYADDFQFPDARGSFFDLLDQAVARGLDVRVIFWRPNPESAGYGRVFSGSPAERDFLQARSSGIRIRWDRAPGPFC